MSARFNSEAELSSGGLQNRATLLALDPAEKIGQVEVISGTYELGEMRAAVLELTAVSMGGLQVGDVIDVAYSFPQPCEKGSAAMLGASQRRAAVLHHRRHRAPERRDRGRFLQRADRRVCRMRRTSWGCRARPESWWRWSSRLRTNWSAPKPPP